MSNNKQKKAFFIFAILVMFCVSVFFTACDDTNSGATIKSCEHNFVIESAKSATCTTDGYTAKKYCSKCGYVEKASTIIPAFGHNIQKVAGKNVTCTEDGWSEYEKCTRCNYSTYSVIKATGHDYNSSGYCIKCGTQLSSRERWEKCELLKILPFPTYGDLSGISTGESRAGATIKNATSVEVSDYINSCKMSFRSISSNAYAKVYEAHYNGYSITISWTYTGDSAILVTK